MLNAAVLSLIVPEWTDSPDFFQPLRVYEKDVSFTCFDCLSPIMGTKTIHEAVEKWKNILKNIINDFDIFIGFAFGGTLLQLLFETGLLKNKIVILFASPSFVDLPLKKKLAEIISLAEKRQLQETLMLIEHYAANKERINECQMDKGLDIDRMLERVITGFQLLEQADARSALLHTPELTWAFVGDESQLATTHNVCIANKINVPQASMRLFQDNPVFLYHALDEIFSVIGEKKHAK